MGKYDFADYTTLDKKRQFLWWFDEYLRHDCLWVKFKDVDTVILVERYDLANYPFAELYSDYLYDLAVNTDIVFNNTNHYEFSTALYLQVDLSDLGDIGRVIFTYYTPSERNTMLNRSRLQQNLNKLSFYRFVKHHRVITEPTIVNLLSVAKYSLVISGATQDLVDAVKAKIPSEFLYDNIVDWQNDKNPIPDILEDKTLKFNITHEFLPSGSDLEIEIRNNIYYDYELDLTVQVYPQKIIYKNNYPNTISYLENATISDPLSYREWVIPDPPPPQPPLFRRRGSHVLTEEQLSSYPAIGYEWDSDLKQFVRTVPLEYIQILAGVGETPIEQDLDYFDVDNEVLEKTDLESVYSVNLIRAKPQANVLDGMLYSRIDSSLVDKNFGTELSTVFDTDLVYLLGFNPVVLFRELDSQTLVNSSSIQYYDNYERNMTNELMFSNIPLKGVVQGLYFSDPEDLGNITVYQEETVGIGGGVYNSNSWEVFVKEKSIIFFNEFYFNNYKNFLNFSVGDFFLQLQELINSSLNLYQQQGGITMENPLGYELMIQEIHACLGAGEASYYTDDQGNSQEVVMHLARKVDLLCKFCGLNFALDGSYNDHQSTRYYPPGDTIPGGWYFDQVGINAGWEDSSSTPKAQDNIDIDQQRVGLAYEIRSNLLVDSNGKKVITNSGTVLCNNFIQYIDAIFDDLDKALDWQDLGTGVININDQTFVFEGILDILQEILYQVAESNNNSDESKIAIGVTQQITKEILKAIGLPYGIKTFEYEIQTDWSTDPKNTTGENESLPVPYPATLRGAPTLVDILISIIGNLAVQNTGKFTLKNKKKEEILAQLKTQQIP